MSRILALRCFWPSEDGPPHVMVIGDEDFLRAPCVSIEVRPAAEYGVHQAQAVFKSLVASRPAEDALDGETQPLRALLGNHRLRDETPVDRVSTYEHLKHWADGIHRL